MIRHINKPILTAVILSMLFLTSCIEVIPEAEVINPTNTTYINTLHSGTKTNLEDVHFFNESEGIAIGGSEYLRTTDGGLNWNISTPFKPLGKKKTFLKRVDFVNESVGLIAGYIGEESYWRGRLRFKPTGNVILKTIDGGKTWKNINSFKKQVIIKTVKLFDETTGLLSIVRDGEGEIHKTTDGGLSWKLVHSGVEAYGYHGKRYGSRGLADITYVTNTTVVAVGIQGNVYISLNAGNTWTKDTSAPKDRAFKRVTFFSKTEGYIVGGGYSYPNADKAMVFKLTLNPDGTTTYEDKTDTYHSVFYFNGLHATETGDLWVCGHLGQVFATYQKGETWSDELTKTNREADLMDLDFPTDKIGYFVGRGGIILKVNLAE